MQTRIAAALTRLEADHDIRILYACESGSRAWGFPSPDSDYDVRFIYLRRPGWYLTLDDGPDTLNFPVDEELDLAGWDLRKALKLLRSSNAALFEWLQSPAVYYAAPEFLPAVQPLLAGTFNLRAGLHHYLGLVRRGLETDLTGEAVRLKRLFYALRSALAARWIRTRHALPPIEFTRLRELLPAALSPEVDELLERKAQATEKTTVPRPAALVEFLEQEYAACQAARDTLPVPTGSDPTPELNKVFQQLLAGSFPLPL
ncbi:nucleotidyltransferase domain-containing protein [Hymenobacter cellulosivorans]|uniref:Nucleotidyltransferase domain-containing protein n=1 Tax=Hymenobacter cellulosivorans TaxID=2932249 RepID=A0ABY4F8D5_9BACT|nr:nucleotidyltransferase domain-containing protein [Hymenobacter cellulosivorans]UOQ50726.1 nucleotidyltransferase domain-containing protein [Hymenobacter cellulosivorans]